MISNVPALVLPECRSYDYATECLFRAASTMGRGPARRRNINDHQWAMWLASPSANLCEQLSMRSAGFDPARAIVVPRHSQITMRKKVARDADLIGSRNCPCRCCSITGVVRGNANSQPSGCVPREHRPDCGIRQCSSFGTNPEGIACWPAEHAWSNVIEICLKIRLQQLGDLKV
jgi:hypothetical protein